MVAATLRWTLPAPRGALAPMNPSVYHRDREHMKAHESEFAEALAEGVKVRWLTNINSIGDGNVLVEEMRLDEHGVPHPTGKTERLTADSVVLALGERADTGVPPVRPGNRTARRRKHRGR